MLVTEFDHARKRGHQELVSPTWGGDSITVALLH